MEVYFKRSISLLSTKVADETSSWVTQMLLTSCKRRNIQIQYKTSLKDSLPGMKEHRTFVFRTVMFCSVNVLFCYMKISDRTQNRTTKLFSLRWLGQTLSTGGFNYKTKMYLWKRYMWLKCPKFQLKNTFSFYFGFII